MVDAIKMLMGITNDDFDSIIEGYISSAKQDLNMVGVSVDETDALTMSAIQTYVLMMLDTPNSEMYANSYSLQKDALRHYGEYGEN